MRQRAKPMLPNFAAGATEINGAIAQQSAAPKAEMEAKFSILQRSSTIVADLSAVIDMGGK